MGYFIGIFHSSAFLVDTADALRQVVSNFDGGHGEIYRFDSIDEAEVAYKQIFLWRQTQINPENCQRNFKFLKGPFYIEIPKDLQLTPPRTNSHFLSSTSTQKNFNSEFGQVISPPNSFLPSTQSPDYWACVGANGYGVTNDLYILQQFLCEDKIIFPAVYAFPTEDIARHFMKSFYLARFHTRFLSHLPAEPINYGLNEFYIDPLYEEYIKQECDSAAWTTLLKNGIFQNYFGG